MIVRNRILRKYNAMDEAYERARDSLQDEDEQELMLRRLNALQGREKMFAKQNHDPKEHQLEAPSL